MIDRLRYYGRKLVLPVDEMKHIIKQSIHLDEVNSIIDFGAGTLFWSEWLLEQYQCQVYPVDISYKEKRPTDERFIFFDDIEECLKEKNVFSMIWLCDVVHHLEPSYWEYIQQIIMKKAEYIVVKDIDARKRLGNFANRMHDRIINGETINDVFPDKLIDSLKLNGYSVKSYNIPKLWYPHFLLVAQRNS